MLSEIGWQLSVSVQDRLSIRFVCAMTAERLVEWMIGNADLGGNSN